MDKEDQIVVRACYVVVIVLLTLIATGRII